MSRSFPIADPMGFPPGYVPATDYAGLEIITILIMGCKFERVITKGSLPCALGSKEPGIHNPVLTSVLTVCQTLIMSSSGGLTLPVYKIRSNKNFHLRDESFKDVRSLMREALCSLEEKYMTK